MSLLLEGSEAHPDRGNATQLQECAIVRKEGERTGSRESQVSLRWGNKGIRAVCSSATERFPGTCLASLDPSTENSKQDGPRPTT